MMNQMTRRQWLGTAAKVSCAALVATRGRELGAAEAAREYPPQRTITSGPKHHWFGYYDKLEFDPTGRFCLGMEVDFEHRSPRPDDVIKIGMVDLRDGDRWIELGESRSWGWQQGCMLQWIPRSASRVLWNDRDGDHFVCHILDVRTRLQRTIAHPVYCLSPDGRTAFSADFRRINDMRPGYGYAGLPDPYADNLAPAESGIFRVDLETGDQQLIVPLSEVAKYPLPKEDPYFPPDEMPKAKHYFNHLLVNTDGTRLEFLHRWRPQGATRWLTRMFTCAPDGSDLRCIINTGMASHFIWRDPDHILVWARHASHGDKFYVVEDREGGSFQVVAPDVMTRDGHCTYLPDREWIVNDTYPDAKREQTVYLYHLPTGRRVELG
ncbi:MAG: hypothetical protein JJ992_06925, partial [Planctomycetes bacterium]|nr:hypothetical protein [Planctomycetota bacterium]